VGVKPVASLLLVLLLSVAAPQLARGCGTETPLNTAAMIQKINDDAAVVEAGINSNNSLSNDQKNKALTTEELQRKKELDSVGALKDIQQKCLSLSIPESEANSTEPTHPAAEAQTSSQPASSETPSASGFSDHVVFDPRTGMSGVSTSPGQVLNLENLLDNNPVVVTAAPSTQTAAGEIQVVRDVAQQSTGQTPGVASNIRELAGIVRDSYYSQPVDPLTGTRELVDLSLAGHGSPTNGVRLGPGTPEENPENFLNDATVDYFREATTDPDTGRSMLDQCTLFSCRTTPNPAQPGFVSRIGANNVTSFTERVFGDVGAPFTDPTSGITYRPVTFSTPGSVVNTYPLR